MNRPDNSFQEPTRRDPPGTYHEEPEPQTEVRPPTAALLIVLLVALIAFGIHTDQPNDYTHDELFYLTCALVANETGDWVIHNFHGEIRLKKPPLQYWLVSTSYRMFGVGAFQGRLPSVLAGTACVGLTYWLALMLFRSHRVGLYAACVLMSSYLFMLQSHWALTDSVLALFVMLAFCGFAAAWARQVPWGPPLAWVAMALAVLQKGPVGLFVPLGAVVGWRFWTPRETRLPWRSIFSPVGVPLFFGLVLIWPILALNRLGLSDFADAVTQEIGESWGFSAVQGMAHLVAYLADSLCAVFPFSPLLLIFALKRSWTPAMKLLWSWWCVLVVIFSVAVVNHRVRYLVPTVPALALLAGSALLFFQQQGGRAWRWIQWGALAWFTAAALVGVPLLMAATKLIQTRAAVLVASLLPVFSLCMLWLLPKLARKASPSTWVVAVAVGITIVHTLVGVSIHATLPDQPAFALARKYLRRANPPEVAVIGLSSTELSWGWIGAGYSFGPTTPVAGHGTGKTNNWLLASRAALEAMPDQVRTLFTAVEHARGTSGGLSLRQMLMRPDRVKDEWLRNERHLILLRRK